MRFSVVAASRVGVDALRVNPLRTALSTLGVIIGVASLVAVLSLGDGMERMARAEVERTTDVQTVSVTSKTTETVDGQTLPVRDYPVFTLADASAFFESFGYDVHVVEFGPRRIVRGEVALGQVLLAVP